MNSENPYQTPETDSSIVEAKVACPKCNGPCESGIIQSFGNITWYPTMTSFKMSVPQRLSPKGINLESKIPAIKCGDCNLVMVDLPAE